jgi:ATP-dependent Lhr-like helicase
LHYDRVNDVLRGRRGAALTAITNGGAIPDQFDYDVVLLPSEQPIGTVNEDFAFESLPGDIFQLGNTSYRIHKVQTGKVYVEDAQGKPPNIPFWFGEAPGRSDELSRAVASLRARIDAALATTTPGAVAARLATSLGLDASAASQLVDYLAAARAALDALPTQNRIVLERFFDETGDSHLVIHSPYGSRINRAWGLALRKRFCRRFNFELQAAALEDSIVLSLGAVHSFALEDVIGYLTSRTVRDVLAQAVLGAPIFGTYWRWNATTALGVRRFRNGKKAPPQFQRSDAEDLLATVFPDQLACAENLPGGDIEIPDHPLVAQTLGDCMHRAMDIEGLEALLTRIESGATQVACRDLASPSPLAQEILGAKPYAFLDDAPAEERRTLAVQARRFMSPEQAAELGRLDPAAIERVRAEAWPDARNADELHDALVVLGFMTYEEAQAHALAGSAWKAFFTELCAAGRATEYTRVDGVVLWVAAERLAEVELVFPDGAARPPVCPVGSAVGGLDTALLSLVRSRLEAQGPVTAEALARLFGSPAAELAVPLAALEQQGIAMRGRFTGVPAEEWCERRLLARIHRYTLNRLRNEIEPVSLADYQRFLFEWQGLGTARREGREALRAVLAELEGLALPAAVWERDVLPARISDYGGDLIDALCAAGELIWWRPRAGTERTAVVAASPIAIVPRAMFAHWRCLAARNARPDADASLSPNAERVAAALSARGALFFLELVQHTGLLRVQVEDALAELVAQGRVTADAFNGLRVLLTPQRRRQHFGAHRRRRALATFDAAGRWTLLESDDRGVEPALAGTGGGESARASAVEHAAFTVLRRYGVVARAVLARETLLPTWRELTEVWRRAEARGEIRGGRFVAALSGEQYALNEAVESLRRVRRDSTSAQAITISAADPLHLHGIAGATQRVPAVAAQRVVYRGGALIAASSEGDRVAELRNRG